LKKVAVYEANHAAEAHLVQQHLNRAGIEAEVRGEHIPYPGIPFPQSMLAVWVPVAQEEEAREILAEVHLGEEEPTEEDS
jgi:hypothetical protein